VDTGPKEERGTYLPSGYTLEETEALGQAEIVRLLTNRLDRELPEPLAAVLEREERQRVQVRELLAREGPS
jgi:hypothetical protein